MLPVVPPGMRRPEPVKVAPLPRTTAGAAPISSATMEPAGAEPAGAVKSQRRTTESRRGPETRRSRRSATDWALGAELSPPLMRTPWSQLSPVPTMRVPLKTMPGLVK